MLQQLRQLGFTLYEAKLLQKLLKYADWTTADELAKTGVPRTRIYSILIKLEQRGLIVSSKGRPRKYKINPKLFFDQLKKETEGQLKRELKRKISLIKELRASAHLKFEEIEVRYFTEPESYWRAYLDEVLRFKKGELYRVINSIRLTFGLLEHEIVNIPSLRTYAGIEPALVQGAKLHYIVNPTTIVKRTIAELEEQKLVKRSIDQMLSRMWRYRKQIAIDIEPVFKNLLVAILPRCVCLEFYSKSSIRITSALMIFGEPIVRDFANWFDMLCKHKHNPERDWRTFARAVRKALKAQL